MGKYIKVIRMINLLGPEPRSTRHATFVKRVRKYLEKKCGRAGFEQKVVPGHITDAYGFNKKSKLIYLCEVKVRRSDLRRAPYQIYETALRFKKKRKDFDTVVPVIAIPVKLQRFLIEEDNWEPLCVMCNNLGIAIWVIEQSTVLEVLGPNKKKTNRTKKIIPKKRAVERKKPKTITSKTKTTVKKQKTQNAKRKTSRFKVAKTKPTKKR